MYKVLTSEKMLMTEQALQCTRSSRGERVSHWSTPDCFRSHTTPRTRQKAQPPGEKDKDTLCHTEPVQEEAVKLASLDIRRRLPTRLYCSLTEQFNK